MIATVHHKLGDQLNIRIKESEKGPVLYDRYVPLDSWEADPEAVLMAIADFLAVPAESIQTTPYTNKAFSKVVMTQDEMDTKRAEVAAELLKAEMDESSETLQAESAPESLKNEV